MNETDIAEFKEGYNAFLNEKSRWDNPYDSHTDKRLYWANGWKRAKEYVEFYIRAINI